MEEEPIFDGGGGGIDEGLAKEPLLLLIEPRRRSGPKSITKSMRIIIWLFKVDIVERYYIYLLSWVPI